MDTDLYKQEIQRHHFYRTYERKTTLPFPPRGKIVKLHEKIAFNVRLIHNHDQHLSWKRDARAWQLGERTKTRYVIPFCLAESLPPSLSFSLSLSKFSAAPDCTSSPLKLKLNVSQSCRGNPGRREPPLPLPPRSFRFLRLLVAWSWDGATTSEDSYFGEKVSKQRRRREGRKGEKRKEKERERKKGEKKEEQRLHTRVSRRDPRTWLDSWHARPSKELATSILLGSLWHRAQRPSSPPRGTNSPWFLLIS